MAKQAFKSVFSSGSIVDLQNVVKQYSAGDINSFCVSYYNNYYYFTPLGYFVYATDCSNEGMLTSLLESGSNPNLGVNCDNRSSLYLAFQQNRSTGVKKLLIRYGATIRGLSEEKWKEEYEKIALEVNQEKIQENSQQSQSKAKEKSKHTDQWNQIKEETDVKRICSEMIEQLQEWMKEYQTQQSIKEQFTQGNIPIGCWKVFSEFVETKSKQEENLKKNIKENSQEITKIDQEIQLLTERKKQLESTNKTLQVSLEELQSIELEKKMVQTYAQVEKNICEEFDNKFQSNDWNWSVLTPTDLSVALNRATLFPIVSEIQKTNPTSGKGGKLKRTLQGRGLKLDQFSLVNQKQFLLCLNCLENQQTMKEHFEQCGVCGENDLQGILEEYKIDNFPHCELFPRHLPYVSADDLINMNMSKEESYEILDKLEPLTENHNAAFEQ